MGGTAVTVDVAGNLTARGTDAFNYDAANRPITHLGNPVEEA